MLNCFHREKKSYIYFYYPWNNLCLLHLVLSSCTLVKRVPPSSLSLPCRLCKTATMLHLSEPLFDSLQLYLYSWRGPKLVTVFSVELQEGPGGGRPSHPSISCLCPCYWSTGWGWPLLLPASGWLLCISVPPQDPRAAQPLLRHSAHLDCCSGVFCNSKYIYIYIYLC